MKKNSSYTDYIRQENELTKLKIQAEFGFQMEANEEMNPALENIWLNQILEYERAMVNNRTITICELIGSPPCKPVKEIDDVELITELVGLLELLRSKKIVIDSRGDVADREMYRFITEELFLTETDEVTPKNMITYYTYEDFHPDDENDIRRSSEGFIDSFARKDDEYFRVFILDGRENEELANKGEKLVHRLELFRDAFDEIRKENFSIERVVLKDTEAEVHFDFSLGVRTPGSNKFHHITGPGKFIFSKDYDFWNISDIVMTGVV